MNPTMPIGSLVYIKRDSVYKSGDIITFKNKTNQIVTHRIFDMDGKYIITKGDANETADKEIITMDQVIGKTILTIPHLGSVVLNVKKLMNS